MRIRNLYEAASEPKKAYMHLYALLPGKVKLPLSGQVWIEDETYYMLGSPEKRSALAKDFKHALEIESYDDCWMQHDGIEVYSSFPDVAVMVCDKDDIDHPEAKYYPAHMASDLYGDGNLYVICGKAGE